MKKKDDFKTLRERMVNEQIIARGVKDKLVIDAMLTVPRHLFVPKSSQTIAYIDSPLPIGKGQTISQPYIVAFMTELLELKGNEKVLEVGTGSGYQAAILGEIVKKVYTIEIICELAQTAEKRLKELGYKNIQVRCGDGYIGWEEYAPFDRIIVTAAPDHIPQPLIKQLKNNGRMVIPVGAFWQELILITKDKNGKIKKSSTIPVRFVPLVH
jgi:protein-L-isoaspartate(D-aspartate) O-methyltransferase